MNLHIEITRRTSVTSELVGHFKAIPNDNADEDFGSSPILVTTGSTTQCAGTNTQEKWVADASKDGNVYFMHRAIQMGTSPLTVSLGSSLITSPGFTSPCSSRGVSNNVFITTSAGKFVKIAQNSIM